MVGQFGEMSPLQQSTLFGQQAIQGKTPFEFEKEMRDVSPGTVPSRKGRLGARPTPKGGLTTVASTGYGTGGWGYSGPRL
jgi:hypothetical protein